MNLQSRKRLTDLQNEFMVLGAKDSQGFGVGHVHTAIFKMDNQQRPTVQYMKLCSMLCASLGGKGLWWRLDTCVSMVESLPCLPETTTTLLIGYTPIQNAFGVKKIKILKKKNLKRKK